MGRGAMSSCHVGVAGVAKAATESDPYAVANEFLCDSLARALRLPIPPGFLVEREGDPYYVSLNFLLTGEGLPPADAAKVVANHAELSWGIILFDAWVVNGDRHAQNLAYDSDADRVMIFDHSHAFYRGTQGRASVERHEEGSGVSGHCLACEIVTLDGFDDWLQRIAEVPDYYVRESIRDAVDVGLPEADEDFCIQFLLERRRRLKELVTTDAERMFPKLQRDLWHQADGETDGEPLGVSAGEVQRGGTDE